VIIQGKVKIKKILPTDRESRLNNIKKAIRESRKQLFARMIRD